MSQDVNVTHVWNMSQHHKYQDSFIFTVFAELCSQNEKVLVGHIPFLSVGPPADRSRELKRLKGLL